MKAKIDTIKLENNNATVNGKKIIVSSVLPMSIENVWSKLQESKTLEFVAKNRVIFEPVGEGFSERWEIGKTYQTKMKFYGFLPSPGVHHIFFESKDDENFIIKTKERGDSIKIWNHTMSLKAIDKNKTAYTDEVVVYNGFTTALMALWTKSYYKHRHRRWLELIRE